MVTVNLRDVNGGVTKLCGEQVQKQFDMMEQSSASLVLTISLPHVLKY